MRKLADDAAGGAFRQDRWRARQLVAAAAVLRDSCDAQLRRGLLAGGCLKRQFCL